MPVDISVKGVPDALAEALRRRAAAHNRTVDEEVVGILEATMTDGRDYTIGDLLGDVQATGLRSPSDSAAIVREDRDGGHRR